MSFLALNQPMHDFELYSLRKYLIHVNWEPGR